MKRSRLRETIAGVAVALVVTPSAPPLDAATAKPPLHGRHWVAITGKPLGATAGSMMFQQGGNAVDAACAMLAATSTMWDTLGWGGETQALVYNPKTKKVIGVNALGVAPTGATPALFKSKGLVAPPEFGPLAVRHARHAGRAHADAAGVGHPLARGRAGAGHPDGGRLRDRGAAGERDRAAEGEAQGVAVLEGGLPAAPRRGARGAGAGRGVQAARPRGHAAQAGGGGSAGARRRARTGARRIQAAYDRFYTGDIARELVRGVPRAGRPRHDGGPRALAGRASRSPCRRATRASTSTS